MRTMRWTQALGALSLAAALSGCATASSPWAGHAERADSKAARLDPSAICPVELHNGTPSMLDARYEVVGMSFDLGPLPAGQAAQFHVQCRAEQVRAMGVARAEAFEAEPSRFQTVARLDPAHTTRLRLTTANAIR